MMYVLPDYRCVETRNRQNDKFAEFVIFVITLQGQESLTVELHKEQHESTH